MKLRRRFCISRESLFHLEPMSYGLVIHFDKRGANLSGTDSRIL